MPSAAATGILIAAVLLGFGCARQSTPSAEEERNAKFKAAIDGVTLQGNMRGLGKDTMSKGEKFVIEKVTRVMGDTWLFQMRFQYGDHDVPVPIPMRVNWAGDTPVLTLTDVPVPGFGTYTARVLIYGEQFAGMWSSQKGHGGQVFGKVVRGSGVK